jgi:electron transport complex protein RnfB
VSPVTASPPSLADRIEDLLPQTQCTKCGYAGCRPYAEAIADGSASYDQCPPGGAEGIARLATLLGKPVIPLNPENGVERPRTVAQIDEAICIGCTLCIQACPVDAIVGAAKRMHTVIESMCTGCDLCVAPCPVDCIDMIPVTGDATGWQAWSQAQADAARAHHDRHLAREQASREAAERRIAERHAAHLAQSESSAAEAASTVPADASATPASTPSANTHTEQVHVSAQGTSATDPSETARIDTDSDATTTTSTTLSPEERKKAIIAAAMERARQKKKELTEHGLGPKNTTDVSASVQAQIDEADARRKRLGIDQDDNS